MIVLYVHGYKITIKNDINMMMAISRKRQVVYSIFISFLPFLARIMTSYQIVFLPIYTERKRHIYMMKL